MGADDVIDKIAVVGSSPHRACSLSVPGYPWRMDPMARDELISTIAYAIGRKGSAVQDRPPDRQ
jgi:hypothetical protein